MEKLNFYTVDFDYVNYLKRAELAQTVRTYQADELN